ncbi:hypothetical protein GVN24_13830 [Rhizobium sp. CRIBSB]|nr:hypothetical protein [Rhizobium sp. CRIBSB]
MLRIEVAHAAINGILAPVDDLKPDNLDGEGRNDGNRQAGENMGSQA